MSETNGHREKVASMTGQLVRSGNDPAYARKVSVDAARRNDRGAVQKKAKAKPSYNDRLRAARSEAELALRGPVRLRGTPVRVRDWMNGEK